MSYEQDYSHTHCYVGQEGHERHIACCICRKQNPANNTEDWRDKFMHRFSLALQGATKDGHWIGDEIIDFIAQERALAVKEVVEGIVSLIEDEKEKHEPSYSEPDDAFIDGYEKSISFARSFIPKYDSKSALH